MVSGTDRDRVVTMERKKTFKQAIWIALLVGLMMIAPAATVAGDDEDPVAGHDPADDTGWPDIGDAKIRPGMQIGGGSCTANFIFSTPDNSTLYIGTASHCVGGHNIGDRIQIASYSQAGILVFCSWMHTEGTNNCPGSTTLLDPIDFALVEIRDDYRERVHPAVRHWGGPTGISDPPSLATKMHTFGNSGLNPLGPLKPMEGYSTGSNPESTSMYSVRPGVFGDSGSPVMKESGEAVGTLVAIATFLPGENVISNVGRALEYMTGQTGIEVELKTWEVLESGVLP